MHDCLSSILLLLLYKMNQIKKRTNKQMVSHKNRVFISTGIFQEKWCM